MASDQGGIRCQTSFSTRISDRRDGLSPIAQGQESYRGSVATTGSAGWAPEACTLPTVDQPLRLAEFDALFATALIRQERIAAQRLRWWLDPAAEVTVRDLTARESECCSFFSFTIKAEPTGVKVDVEVPRAHADVLDALESRAATAMATR